MLRLVILNLFILICLSASILGQQPRKIAETDFLRCDLGEMWSLHDLSDELRKNPNSMGLILIKARTYGWAKRYAKTAGSWMSKSLGIMPSRIRTVAEQSQGSPEMEVWVLPKGSSFLGKGERKTSSEVSVFDSFDYELAEYCSDTRIPALKVFGEELLSKKDAKGYIVFYGGKEKFAQ